MYVCMYVYIYIYAHITDLYTYTAHFRGNHLSSTTCLTHVFFESRDGCGRGQPGRAFAGAAGGAAKRPAAPAMVAYRQ